MVLVHCSTGRLLRAGIEDSEIMKDVLGMVELDMKLDKVDGFPC